MKHINPGVALMLAAAILIAGCHKPASTSSSATIPPGPSVDAPKATPQQAALKKLQGVWKFESIQSNGKPVPAETLRDLRMTVAGEKYTVTKGAKLIEQATFKIDPAAKPMTFDFTIQQGEVAQGQTLPGIVEVDGDTLRICFGVPGKDRPKEFASRPGSGLDLNLLQREKP